MAPNPINLYGLVAYMAPKPINLYGLVTYKHFRKICAKHVPKDGGGPRRGPPPSFDTDFAANLIDFYSFSLIRPVH
jgi:hypothetical protein